MVLIPVMVLMPVMVRMVFFAMSTFAVGAIAFADVLFFLLNKHAVAVNGHRKSVFSFKNNLFCGETAEDQRFFKAVNGCRSRLAHLAHVNKNTFAVHVVDTQKVNNGIGLNWAELVIEANMQIVLTETVGNVRNRREITIINHALPPKYVISWGTLSQLKLDVNRIEFLFQLLTTWFTLFVKLKDRLWRIHRYGIWKRIEAYSSAK